MAHSYVNQKGEKKQEYDFSKDYKIVSVAEEEGEGERDREIGRQADSQPTPGASTGSGIFRPVGLHRCLLMLRLPKERESVDARTAIACWAAG